MTVINKTAATTPPPPRSTVASAAAPAIKLALVFAASVSVTLALCALLLQRVRAHDEAAAASTTATDGGDASLAVPLDQLSLRSFASLDELQRSHATFAHVFAVERTLALLCFACIYTIKQTFAIPGSALLNVFAGAMLPLYVAVPLVATLTAIGASNCYLLSHLLGSEQLITGVCDRIVPGKLAALRTKLDASRARGELLYVLLFLRVFPFSPNWFLNLASPWLQVPLVLFTPSVFVGLLPYNALTVQAGAMLATLKSPSDLLDARAIASLVVLALGMLIPAIVKKQHGKTDAAEKARTKTE